MHIAWRDLRYAVRMLLKNSGLNLAAVVTLALGIGATTCVFSVLEAVLAGACSNASLLDASKAGDEGRPNDCAPLRMNAAGMPAAFIFARDTQPERFIYSVNGNPT